jgi:hypothetical protein
MRAGHAALPLIVEATLKLQGCAAPSRLIQALLRPVKIRAILATKSKVVGFDRP